MPTTHRPLFIAYADAKWQKRMAGALSSPSTLPIEHLDAVDHGQGGRAGFDLMVGNIQRRVPECHDRITDVFVDGSFVIDDRVRERVKQPIH